MDHTSNCICICKTWFLTMSQNESQKVSSKLCSKLRVLQPHCTRLMQIARYSWLSWHVASVWCLVIGKGYQNPTWRRSNPKSRWGLEEHGPTKIHGTETKKCEVPHCSRLSKEINSAQSFPQLNVKSLWNQMKACATSHYLKKMQNNKKYHSTIIIVKSSL